MRKLPLLLLFVIAVTAAQGAALAVHAEEWKSAGVSLYPGYRVGVTLTAKYDNKPFRHDWGEPGVEFGDIKAVIIGEGKTLGGEKFYLVIYQGSDQELKQELKDVGWTDSGSVSVALTIDIKCDGMATLSYDGEPVVSFTVDDSGVDVLKQTGGMASVSVYTIGKYNCGGSTTTTSYQGNPPPGDGNGGTDLSGIFAGAAGKAFLVLLLGLVALVLLIAFSQARRRGLVTMG